MQTARQIDARDGALIQIVDAAMIEAARRAGPWLVCRVGCTECCIGPFPITQLDARRLRQALAELQACDPDCAARVQQRARGYVARTSHDFPGDPHTGILARGEDAEARFSSFADAEPCPALDPETGACDLYTARPITCRTFGPPVRSGSEGVGVCQLCFHGASDDEISACEVEPDPAGAESDILDELGEITGEHGETIVAFCLAS